MPFYRFTRPPPNPSSPPSPPTPTPNALSTRHLNDMLAVLAAAHRHGSPHDRAAADRLQRRLLHDDLADSGLLPVLARLMGGFNFARQGRAYACDLVTALSHVLKMYDRCGRGVVVGGVCVFVGLGCVCGGVGGGGRWG